MDMFSSVVQLCLALCNPRTAARQASLSIPSSWLYLKWIANKDLLCSTGNSAQCYGAAWMGGDFGGECMHVLYN